MSVPTVGVVRIERHEDLSAAWRRALELTPALLRRPLPSQVVIKPNLCDNAAWETGVTTDPRWIGVLARELRSIVPEVRIRVVESDAISTYKTYRSCQETFERLGFITATSDAGVELVNLSKADSIEISLQGIPYPVRIPQLFLEEFFFISIANLKVHPYERMTGILKNSLGLLTDADISACHPYLSRLISWLHRLCPPDLCIIDGRIGLEGQGPILGDPVPMDTVIFGNDALATDATACQLMEIPPKDVPHLRQTAKDLGRDFSSFQLAGEMHPRKFAFDPGGAHRSILTKFANRRLHGAAQLFSNRWIDRFYRFRRAPVAFTKLAVARLARRAHGR